MARFLIEVPHENKRSACERAVRAFMETGSHFVTNADWGCKDDEHKAWIVVDLDSRQEAMSILPPHFRQDARVIMLERFTIEDVEKVMEQHSE